MSRASHPHFRAKSKNRGCYECCSGGGSASLRTFGWNHYALNENRRVPSKQNMLCLKCRTVNACGIHGHTRHNIGSRIRPPRKTASDQQWAIFTKRFAARLKCK